MNFKLKLSQARQAGFTFVEVLIALAIVGMMGAGTGAIMNQTFRQNSRASGNMSAIAQVENVAYWINRDTLMTQDIVPGPNSGFPLILSWQYQDTNLQKYGDSNPHTVNNQVTYTALSGNRLQRTLSTSVDGGTATLTPNVIASNMNFDPAKTNCSYSNIGGAGVLNFLATSTIGSDSETRSYQIKLRVDQPSSNAAPLSINTLASGSVGVAYNWPLASGGTPPYTLSIILGSLPPASPSFSLNGSTGVLVGTPTTVGTYNFTARVTDSVSSTVQANLQMIIHSAPPSTLAVTGNSTTTAGQPYIFTVTAKDSSGNIVTDYDGTVHFASDDSQAVLPGDYTFQASDNGIQTFTATLKTAGTRSITATDTAISSVTGTQSGIMVSAATASKIVFTTASQTLTAGTASSVMTVKTQDAYGNIANVGSNTTINLSSSSANGKFDTSSSGPFNGSITSVTIASGANAANFYYKDTNPGRPTLTASAAGLTNGTQQEINVGPAYKLAFTTQPSNSTVNSPFSTQPVVTIQDSYGNIVTSSTASVTVNIGTNPPGNATLKPTQNKTVSAVGGVAAFSGLYIDKTGSGYTLVASSGTLQSATSNAFNVN